MPLSFLSSAFKLSYLIFVLPTALVFITAILSAKEMGGGLGRGLKKIAVGTIIHTSLVTAYILLENYPIELPNDNLIKLSFVVNGLAGSIFLIIGFIQVYRITKEFRLFTP